MLQQESTLQWTYTPYAELSTDVLYQILHLRSKVFVVEQNCVYLDMDNKDQFCWHLCGWDNQTLVAYARIIPPSICFDEASIGRVITHPDHRKKQYGKQLMETAIDKTLAQFNVQQIRIGAQCYLIDFYSQLGFQIAGEEYIEDGIPHVEMLLSR